MVPEITMLPVFLMGVSFFGRGKSGSVATAGEGSSSDKAKEAIKTLRNIGVGYLTAEQLQLKLASAKPPILLNVLDEDSYRESHIKGSINVPYTRIEQEASEVIPSMSSEVVVHCASYECPASIEAAKTLKRLGYTNVHDFKGGMEEWMDRKYPVEGSGVRQSRAA